MTMSGTFISTTEAATAWLIYDLHLKRLIYDLHLKNAQYSERIIVS